MEESLPLPPDTLPPAVPLAPRTAAQSATPLAAQRLLEEYRILALAMATRALATQWDSGLLAREATAAFTPGTSNSFPYEQEALALLGAGAGLASQQRDQAEQSCAHAINAIARAHQAFVGEPPLVSMRNEFALNPLEEMILLLVAAPTLWGPVRLLYRLVVSKDEARPQTDEHLLAQLLGPSVNPHTVAQALYRGAPLIANGLLEYEAEFATSSTLPGLRVTPLTLARLRGESLLEDPQVPAHSEPRPNLDIYALLDEHARTTLAAWARSKMPFARLVLRGRLGAGRSELAHAIAASANRRLHHIALSRYAPEHLLHRLQKELLRARAAGWVPMVSDVDLARERYSVAQLRAAFDEYRGPLLLRLGLEENAPLAPGYHQVDLTPLAAERRMHVWQQQLSAHDLPIELASELATRWRVGPATIAQVANHVAKHTNGDRRIATLSARINAAVLQTLQSRLGDIAERVTHLPALSDMVLPSDITDSLTEFLARNRLAKQVYETWGMAQVVSTARGITALFQGAPGTGKTMVAGALARELGLDLYRVDLSKILSKWMGETERNLANVFAAAEDGHAVILFDEADSLFAKRTEVKSSNDRHANLEVNYLLQRLDSFTGIAILTTNFGTAIDAAFKRRLSFRLTFPVPDEETREQLWRKHLPPTIPTAKLDLADLARKYHFAGGAVRNCVLRAAFLAAAENSLVTQDHLLRAIRLEYRAVGKLSEGGPLE